MKKKVCNHYIPDEHHNLWVFNLLGIWVWVVGKSLGNFEKANLILTFQPHQKI